MDEGVGGPEKYQNNKVSGIEELMGGKSRFGRV